MMKIENTLTIQVAIGLKTTSNQAMRASQLYLTAVSDLLKLWSCCKKSSSKAEKKLNFCYYCVHSWSH